MTRSGNTYYYMMDGLGSVRNVVESDEDVANVYDYYAFGNTLGTPTTGVTTPFEYTAREFEDGSVNTTLYYRNRYYMSALGVFTSRDTMWPDIHRGWGYVGNNPVATRDPLGLFGDTSKLFQWGPDGWSDPAWPSELPPPTDNPDCPGFQPDDCMKMFKNIYERYRASGMSPAQASALAMQWYYACVSMTPALGDANCPPGFESLYNWQALGYQTYGECLTDLQGGMYSAGNPFLGLGMTGLGIAAFFLPVGFPPIIPGFGIALGGRAAGVGVSNRCMAGAYCGKFVSCVPSGGAEAARQRAQGWFRR